MSDDLYEKGERIAKVIARAGIASRRGAEELIEDGRVKVNGRVITSAALNVTSLDQISVDGHVLEDKEPSRLWLYHKPAGLVTTHRDPQGRPTVFEHLPADLPRVISIGRLDLTSEGLLLLTNDGVLARHLEHPDTGWRRRYRVRIYQMPSASALAALARGITVEGVRYKPVQVEPENGSRTNIWLSVTLTEGKNREIRRVFEHLGHPVSRLIRVAYGPFQLGQLAPGAVKEIPRKVLKDQVGQFI
ncbi:MAG: rRNA pseudouridine synthase [Rickettsiales bacterium]|nr:rRNA pseudouridine synthase [Rickettsiales bacterium]